MAKNTVSMKNVKDLLYFTIDNNIRLQEEGDNPVSIGLEAGPGIGKTSVVEQVAKERGMGYTKLSLSQLEEAGDLIGFPLKEYECQVAKPMKQQDGTVKTQILPGTVWLNEKQLESSNKGVLYRQTGKTRMSYAIPAWVPEYNEKGNVVNLDDFSRANPQLLQSVMEIIDKQEYVSWRLPKKTTVVLTSNSDDGTNNVNSLDPAQQTRFMNFLVEFDRDAWCTWAEKAKVDGRCINFVMSYADELFNADAEGNAICNPRSFVMFAKMISGIKDWDNPESLSFIQMIAKGCFKDEGSRFGSMFAAFIRNKMHLLIQPKDMLLGGWDRVKDILEQTVYDSNGQYRPDIASLLERRFSNYVNAWLDSDEKTPIAKVKERILDFIDLPEKGGKVLFNKDLFLHMIKSITSEHKNQTNKLLFEPKIAVMLS